MVNSITIQALNLCVSIARGFVTHGSNKIHGKTLDLHDPEHLHILHQTSLRTLFLIIVILYMEEKELLPQDKKFRSEMGIWGIRRDMILDGKSWAGKKQAIIKRIRETANAVFSGDSVTPFPARLFDKSNEGNAYLFKWKIYDSELAGALTDLFLIWPQEGTSLLVSEIPDTKGIIETYSCLLDYEPKVTDSDVVCLNYSRRVIPLADAHPSDIKRGKVVGKGCVIFEYAKGRSRKSGTVYTPDEIVNRIVERTIGDYIREKGKLSDPIRILDPSCGTGLFLDGAIDYLSRKTPNISEREIIRKSIFGIDQDSLAIELAEIRLMLRTHSADNPAESLNQNLITGDSLSGVDSSGIRKLLRYDGKIIIDSDDDSGQATFDESEWNEIWCKLSMDNATNLAAAFDHFSYYLSGAWNAFEVIRDNFNCDLSKFMTGQKVKRHPSQRHCYPEISFPYLFHSSDGSRLSNPGFDIVIGNPPYGDILDTRAKTSLKNLGYKSGGGGNNDIFRFFVERGLNLLKSGGLLGFILPNTFLKGRKYSKFRRRIMDLSYPEEILDFDLAKIFERDVYTAILTLRKKPAHPVEPAYFTSIDGSVKNLRRENFDPEQDIDDSWLPSGDLFMKFRDDVRFSPLDPYFVRIGDVGINYQRRNVGWTQRTKSRIADEIFYEGERQHPEDKLYLKGEDVERFHVNPKVNRWLRHDFSDRVSDSEVVNVNLEWAMRPVKILSRQTGDSIIAAIDRDRFLTGRSLHTSIVRDFDYSPYYIVALMNSSVLTNIYRELTREQGRPQAQVKLSFLRQLPIRKIDFNMSESVRKSNVDAIREQIGNSPDRIPEVIQLLMKDGKNEIIHDLLASLSEKLACSSMTNGGLSNGEMKKLRDVLDESVRIFYGVSE